jgi:hypothetical protein
MQQIIKQLIILTLFKKTYSLYLYKKNMNTNYFILSFKKN